VARALLSALIVVGLVLPSLGVCFQDSDTGYTMPCCAGASCAMGEQMGGASCCAAVQGEFNAAPVAAPASTCVPSPAHAARTAQTVPTHPPRLTPARAYSLFQSVPQQHPLQI